MWSRAVPNTPYILCRAEQSLSGALITAILGCAFARQVWFGVLDQLQLGDIMPDIASVMAAHGWT